MPLVKGFKERILFVYKSMNVFIPQLAYSKILSTDIGNFDANARTKRVDNFGIRRWSVP